MKSTPLSFALKNILSAFALLAALCAGCHLRAGTIAGTLPGEFSVDNKGAANYTIPLPLPPGRGGMQPQPALCYNSSAGSGPLGIGFSLSTGFPQSISRGRSLLARDGVVHGIGFDANDKFYLDGKRLICVSGTYGAPGSVYRTEVDSFMSIAAFGSDGDIEGFRVTTKEGVMLCFGKNVQDGSGNVVYNDKDGYYLSGATSGPAIEWKLKWVEDTTGNYIKFDYSGDVSSEGGTGEQYLGSIAYTGNRAQSIAPAFRIVLGYTGDSRPDRSIIIYQAGRGYEFSRHLHALAVQDITGGSPVTMRSFAFNYVNPQNYVVAAAVLRLREMEMQDFTQAGTPVTKTLFQWGADASLISPPAHYAHNTAHSVYSEGARGDFDGDGRDELLLFDVGTSPYPTTHPPEGSHAVYLASCDSIGALAPVERPFGTLNLTTGYWPTSFMTGDFNGDGKTDLIWCRTEPGLARPDDGWHVALSTGTGFAEPQVIYAQPPPEPYIWLGGNSFIKHTIITNGHVGDFNGDGRDDLLVISDWKLYSGGSHQAHTYHRDMSWHFITSNSTGDNPSFVTEEVMMPVFPSPIAPSFFASRVAKAYEVMDFDNDGKADLLATTSAYAYTDITPSVTSVSAGSTGEIRLYALRNLGNGNFTCVDTEIYNTMPLTLTDAAGGADATGFHKMIGDVNGDGLPDIVYLKTGYTYIDLDWGNPTGPLPIYEPDGGWHVALSKGDGTFDSAAYAGFPAIFSIPNFMATAEADVKTFHRRNGYYVFGLNPDGTDGYVLAGLDGFDICGVHLLDVNSDGKKDFVFYADGNGWFAVTAGEYGFLWEDPVQLPWPVPKDDFDNLPWRSTTMDIDGNGREDIVFFGPSFLSDIDNGGNPLYSVRSPAIHVALSPSTNANRVIAITDGLGAKTSINYSLTTDSAIYTPGAPVSHPIQEIRRPSIVVSDVYKDAGSDTPADRAHFSYQYSGNRLDLSGRGHLGFHSFVTLDHQTSLFKYQFLTQSFPMTGLAMREQTYRFWHDSTQTNFRLITSHDNTVVFDEVVNPAGNTAYGTVYPFISKAVESRWEDAATPHYIFIPPSDSSQSEFLFTRQKPSGAHITITAESRFDNQTNVQTILPGAYNPSDLATTGTVSTNTVTAYPDYSDFLALTFPQKITHGNLTRLATDFGGGFTETIATTYHAPTANGITGLVASTTTTVTSPGYGTQTAPVKSHTYWSNGSTPTPLVATETTTATDSALTTTTTYTRDSLGRITATAINGYNNTNDPRHIGNYTTAQATAFDTRFDLPSTTLNAHGHDTTTAYHDTLGLPVSVTDVNGVQTTTTYDALGRVTQTRNELLNLQTDTTYAWTSDAVAATDWKHTQTVAPPSNHPGALTLSSVLAVRTAATAQPAITTYHDRLGRPIRTIKEGFNGQLIHTDTVYNNLGQTVATSLPYPAGGTLLWTKITYDPFGRTATITTPNGAVTTNTYAGRATAVTIDAPDRDPQTNVTLVDAKGRTVKVWNADNAPAFNPSTSIFDLNSTTASIEYKLDGFGRMRETLLRGQTQTITATYDALGRQTSLDDPDKGDWTYINNALGQVVSQTDAKGNVTTSAFDRLARPLTRVTAEAASGPVETAHWYYFDTAADTARHLIAQGNKGWIGALQREESITTGAPGHVAAMPATTTAYYYDDKGRPEITLRLIDNKWYYTKTVYDQYNRIAQINHYWRSATDEYGGQDPLAWEDFGYTYTYDTCSYLLALHDTTDQVRAWWEADATAGYDHLDRPVLVRKGNAHWTQRTYRPEDGVLTNIKTGPTAGATSIQNLTYNFDGLGNLTTRANGTLTETFAYDNLNRLTTRNGTTIAAYAINGNITSKVDVSGNNSGNYAYDSAKPHAVASAWGYTMTYDANGNLLTRTGSGETWTTCWTGFDKPRWLAKTNGSSTTGSEFLYNANRSRVMHLEFDAMANDAPSHYTRKKIYAAGPDVEIDYKNTATGAVTTWQRDKVRIYINAPDGPVGTVEFTSPSTINLNSPDKALVYHTDHLGSIESITPWGDTTTALALDDTNKPSRYSYDPWGERRNPLTWTGKPVTTDSGGANGTASRGYTSHEMLDDLGLVHMNGRIYDPLIGRMLTADLFVQHLGELQGFNRYSYVRNNPLTLIDPTGFLDETAFAKRLFKDGDAGQRFLGEMESYSAAGHIYKSFDSYNSPTVPAGSEAVGLIDGDITKTVYAQDQWSMKNTVDSTVHETGHISQSSATTIGEYRTNEHGAYGKATQYQIDAGRPGALAKKEKTKDPVTNKTKTTYRVDSAAIDIKLDDAYKLKGVPHSNRLNSPTVNEANFSGLKDVSVDMIRLAYDAIAAKVASKEANKTANKAERTAKKTAADKNATDEEKAAAKKQAEDARKTATEAADAAKAAREATDTERKRLRQERGY